MSEMHGLKVIESAHLTVGPFENWSRVRSHSRARRRRAKHLQNITYYNLPDPNLVKLPDGTLVGHPATVAKLRHALQGRSSNQ